MSRFPICTLLMLLITGTSAAQIVSEPGQVDTRLPERRATMVYKEEPAMVPDGAAPAAEGAPAAEAEEPGGKVVEMTLEEILKEQEGLDPRKALAVRPLWTNHLSSGMGHRYYPARAAAAVLTEPYLKVVNLEPESYYIAAGGIVPAVPLSDYPVMVVRYRVSGMKDVSGSAMDAYVLHSPVGRGTAGDLLLQKQIVADGRTHEIRIDLSKREVEAPHIRTLLVGVRGGMGPEPAVFELLSLHFERPAGAEPMKIEMLKVPVTVVNDKQEPLKGATVIGAVSYANLGSRAQTNEKGQAVVEAPIFDQSPLDGIACRAEGFVQWMATKGDIHTVKMRPPQQGPYSGRVVDQDGRPVANAVVLLQQRVAVFASMSGGPERRVPDRVIPTLTDNEGRWQYHSEDIDSFAVVEKTGIAAMKPGYESDIRFSYQPAEKPGPVGHADDKMQKPATTAEPGAIDNATAFLPVALTDDQIEKGEITLVLRQRPGNELLDFINTVAFWEIDGTEPTPEKMLAALSAKGRGTNDISQLIAQLGAPAFKDREAAQERLAELGAPAANALSRAAAGDDPEIARRAAELLRNLPQAGLIPDSQFESIRRLMAIRTLGDMRWQAAREKLAALVDDKDPFVAEYAAQAVARIDGKPWSRPQPSGEALDKVLEALPAKSFLVARVRNSPAQPLSALNVLYFSGAIGYGQAESDTAMQITQCCLFAAGAVGNVRVDAVTLAADGDGKLHLYFHGLARAEILNRPLFRKAPSIAISIPPAVEIVGYFVDSRAPADLSAVAKVAQAGALEKSLETMIRETDRTAPFWCVANITDEKNPLRQVRLTGSDKEGPLAISGEATFAAAAGGAEAIKAFVEWRDNRVRGPWHIESPSLVRHMMMSLLENTQLDLKEGEATASIHSMLSEAPAAMILATGALPYGAGAVMPHDLSRSYHENRSQPFWLEKSSPVDPRAHRVYPTCHWHWGYCVLCEVNGPAR